MAHEKHVKRVLHIVSSMDRGGAETLIMNVYRNLDKSNCQFDFVVHKREKGDYDDEINELGGRIYQVPSLGQIGPISYIRQLTKIMSSNSYAAVHSHTDYQSGFPALAAKISKIKKRICHSHSNNWAKGNRIADRLTLKFLQTVIKLSATNFCGCSKEAAEFLFGKKLVLNGTVNILKNGIDVNQFTNVAGSNRNSVIQELNLPEDVKIIGHVGKFSSSKNHGFILKVLKKLHEEDDKFVVLFVGDGPLKLDIEKEAEKLGISNYIRFLGVRTDIPRLMRTFDVFLFPSLFEGFGIVTIEAQCSAIPCVISDAVPKSTDMGLDLVTYINLNESLSVWCAKIKEALPVSRPNEQIVMQNISRRGYNIRNNVGDWLELYGF